MAVNRYDLTRRELEICELVAEGHSNDKIARVLFLTEGTVKNYITTIFEKTGVSNRAQLAAVYIKKYANVETDVYDTDQDGGHLEQGMPSLRLVGRQGLPDVIPIGAYRRAFVIGRFDVSSGKKQCDFEFDQTTKAVSRRHAAITLTDGGAVIEDLHSRAGTFVNGNTITPGILHTLAPGDRISFGGMGADYVFEK